MASTRSHSRTETAAAAAAAARSQVEKPAAKKPKLEEADRAPLMLSPAELERVVDFVLIKSAAAVGSDKVKKLYREAKAAFLPDVSKYIGKIYVSLHIELAGGEANAHFTTTREDWELVKEATDDEAFRLGDVCGKHSDISIGFHPDHWYFSIEEDPYGIAKMVQMHGDGVPYWIEEFLAEQDEEEEK